MLTPILHTLSLFKTIELAQMDGVKLMNRIDTKFVFTINELPAILKELSANYNVLTVNTNVISKYKNLYFDSENFKLFNAHQNGKLNRYKVRHRTYVESNVGYLEVKHKNNKGKTAKTRILDANAVEIKNIDSINFLKKALPFNPEILEPKIKINYSRITLVNKTLVERLTLDLNLEFENNGKTQLYNQLVIAEVKQEEKAESAFVSLMKKNKIKQNSISKYCLGIASMYEQVKKNNYKEKLLKLKKL